MKTKNIILALLFVVIYEYLYAQVWPKYYNKTNYDTYSDDVLEAYDESYFICGNFNTYNGSEAQQWTWLIKTDVNGEVLWDKVIEGGDEYMRTSAIEITMDGGILLCGHIWTEIGNFDPYAMKLNACGEKEWCTIFASSTQINPWAQDIKETQSGDIIMLVNQYGEDNIEDMDLFKLNSIGELQWKGTYCSGNVYPESLAPIGRNLIITQANNYLIAGEVYWEDPWNPGGPKGIRSVFVEVDENGNENWVLPFGLQDSIYGQGKNVLEIDSNRFIGVANKWPIETLETVLVEFNSQGIMTQFTILDNQLISTDISKGTPLDIEISDTLYFIGGLYGVPNAGYSSEIVLDTNIFTNPIVFNFYQHYEEKDPYSMLKTTNNKILSNSTFDGSDKWEIALSKHNLNLEYDTLDPGNYIYDSLCTTPGLPQSGFIFLDDCDIITGVDIPSPEEYYASLKVIPITAFPNPAKDKVTFGLENTEHHKNITLKCFNLMGKQVSETTILTGQKEAATNVTRWPQGMYVAVVYSEGLPVGECKFVVE